jgi:hypothetical protein
MTLMIILFVLIPCALVAGAMHNAKGRSYGAGFLVGLLFGPLGLLFAALSAPDWTEVRRCHQCHGLTPIRRRTCHQCGTQRADVAEG